jgi:hypothetical protein
MCEFCSVCWFASDLVIMCSVSQSRAAISVASLLHKFGGSGAWVPLPASLLQGPSG